MSISPAKLDSISNIASISPLFKENLDKWTQIKN